MELTYNVLKYNHGIEIKKEATQEEMKAAVEKVSEMKKALDEMCETVKKETGHQIQACRYEAIKRLGYTEVSGYRKGGYSQPINTFAWGSKAGWDCLLFVKIK